MGIDLTYLDILTDLIITKIYNKSTCMLHTIDLVLTFTATLVVFVAAGDMMIHRHRRMKGLARPKRCETKAMSSIERCPGYQFRFQSLIIRFNATDVDVRTFGKTAIVYMCFVFAVCLINIFRTFSIIVHGFVGQT